MKMRDVKPRRAPLHALPLLLAGAMALALAACGGDDALITVPETELVPRYLYVSDGDNDRIRGYEIDLDTGALSELAGSPYPAGSETTRMASDPGGSWLYASYAVDGVIAIFEIDPDSGELSDTGNGFDLGPSVGPVDLDFHPSGQWLYTANIDDYTARAYEVDAASGELTAIESPLATGDEPRDITVHPSGNFAYTPDLSGSTITGFSIDANTGALSYTPDGTIAVGGGQPFDIAIAPDGRRLYMADVTDAGVYELTVDPVDGTLTDETFYGLGGSAFSAVITPDGSYLYAARTVGFIDAFSLAGNGNFNALTPPSYDLGTAPQTARDLTIDSTGSLLFAANYTDDTISVFRIDPDDGSLTEAPGSRHSIGGRALGVWVHDVEQAVQ